jgi:hypothetical protein
MTIHWSQRDFDAQQPQEASTPIPQQPKKGRRTLTFVFVTGAILTNLVGVGAGAVVGAWNSAAKIQANVRKVSTWVQGRAEHDSAEEVALVDIKQQNDTLKEQLDALIVQLKAAECRKGLLLRTAPPPTHSQRHQVYLIKMPLRSNANCASD